MYDKIDSWIRQRRKRHARPVEIRIFKHGTTEMPSSTKDEIASSLMDCSLMNEEIAHIGCGGHHIEIISDGKDIGTIPIDADFVEKVLSWCD